MDRQATKPWGFRLEHMWMHHRKFQEVMRERWGNTNRVDNLSEKLKICGANLTQWASREFGSVRKRKKIV